MITSARPTKAKTSLRTPKPALFTAGHLPELNFEHVSNLTDTTGMRHAEGYCMEDNSRALLLTVWACKDRKNQIAHRLLPVYLGFIQKMQTENGYFRDFLGSTEAGSEQRSSEEAFGRTIMALGFLVDEGPSHLLMKTGLSIFSKTYQHVDKLVSLRGIANTVIGVCQVIKYNYPDDVKQDMVISLSNKLVALYSEHKKGGWNWFETTLGSENAVVPLALLNAYEITQNETYLDIAFESMRFLESKSLHNSMDIMAMILFCQQAFRVTREQEYLDRMYKHYQWFLGANDLGRSLYDPATGGCANGLKAKSAGSDREGRSTLSYWISHVAVASALAE